MQKHSLDKEISDNKKIICYKININMLIQGMWELTDNFYSL